MNSTTIPDRVILCPSLLGKSTRFITTDSYLLRRLRILEEANCAAPDLLIRGNCGVGKKTLVLHSWHVRKLSRPLTRGKGQFIRRKSQIDRLLVDADGGDLFIDSIDCLSPELQEYLFVASNNVRIVATASDGYQLNSRYCCLIIDVLPLQQRSKDVPLIVSYLVTRLSKKISAELAGNLSRYCTTTSKLYLLVVNLALLSDCLSTPTIDRAIIDEVLTYNDRKLLQNYFIFFTARIGLPQLLDSYGLREVCKLSERAYIHSSMVENGYNISRVSHALSVPLATLSRKIASYNARRS